MTPLESIVKEMKDWERELEARLNINREPITEAEQIEELEDRWQLAQMNGGGK